MAEQSKHIEPWPGGRWGDTGEFTDNDLAVTRAALSGPDLWIDPQFNGGLFVSGALGDAFKKAKCTSGWGLTRCRVIES
jgi:hypothetical protein